MRDNDLNVGEQEGSNDCVVGEGAQGRAARHISFISFIAAGAAGLHLVPVLHEPQSWVLVPAAWMGSLGFQRLLHVVLLAAPPVWAALWAVLGLELDALLFGRIRKKRLRSDGLSFVAIWLPAWLAGPIAVSRLFPEGRLTAYLSDIPYSVAPLAACVALAGHLTATVAADRRHMQSPYSHAVIVAVATMCSAAIVANIYWLTDPLSSLKLTWVALMLLSSMGMALAMAILRLGAERLERILRTLQGLCDACLRRPVIPMVLLVAVLSVAPLSGLHPLKGKSRAKRDPNIIIITVDTLRADHLGCYGYDLPTTPNIDRFAEEATLFTYCISAASHTVPAMVSMMTSQHPAYYGVNIADGIVMRLEEPTLARTLSENGYRAAAFVNNPLLDRNLRLYGGFDIYDDSLPDFEPMPGLLVEEYLKERKADDTGEYVDNWLTATAGERFFLWVHYMDPHGPYEPPERYLENFPESAYPGGPTKLSLADDKDRGGIPTYQYVKGRVSPQYYKSRYDGEIAFVDACVGRLLTRIKELDLWDNTIIVFTSDHGEALGEHDVYFHHSVDVTEEQLHVPLIVRIPGGEQVGKIDELVATIDIPTTILAAAGVNDNLGGSGRSLLPLIQGKTDGLDREYLVSEDIRDRISFHSRGMKYIADPDGDRLYDLDRDPDELNNMLGENPNLAAPWQSILNDYRSRPKKPGARIDPHDGGQLERLRALGYIN